MILPKCIGKECEWYREAEDDYKAIMDYCALHEIWVPRYCPER